MGLSQAQLQQRKPILTDMGQRLNPGNLISDIVFPPLPGDRSEKSQMQIWDTRHMQIPDDNSRGIGQESYVARHAEPVYIDVTTKNYSQKLLITQRELKIYADNGQTPLSLEMAQNAIITTQLKLQKEKKLADKLNTVANYESGYSTVLTNTWESVSGDPLGDIDTAQKAIEAKITPNAAVMPVQVWRALEKHTDLLEFMKYTKSGRITKADFLTITGLVPIVSDAKYDTGSAITPIWQDSCIVCYIPGITAENMGVMDGEAIASNLISFGRTVYNTRYSAITIDAPLRDHKGAYWVEGEMAYEHQFGFIDNTTDLDSIGGYLIDNAV